MVFHKSATETKDRTEASFRAAGIVPVIKIDEAEKAVELACALQEGGLPVIEITFRTDAAEKAIAAIAKHCKNVFVGAGTVLTEEQARRAIDSGAKFVVSPGSNNTVIEFLLKNGSLIVPGVITPTEIENALSYGLNILKFFPAESFGGVQTLKTLSAPYSSVKWIPTGGINRETVESYLQFPKVLACGASCIATDAMIREGRFEEIKEMARVFSDIKRKCRGEQE